MARCSGARVGCIIGLVARRWAEAAATAAVRWGPLVVSAVGGAEQLCAHGICGGQKNHRPEKPRIWCLGCELGGSFAGWNTAETVSGRASDESEQPFCVYL